MWKLTKQQKAQDYLRCFCYLYPENVSKQRLQFSTDLDTDWNTKGLCPQPRSPRGTGNINQNSLFQQEKLVLVLLPTINLTIVGWLCRMCIRWNSTAGSFPAKTLWVPRWPQHQEPHEDVCQQVPLLGQKSWVAKPAILLPLFWSLTFANLESITLSAVTVMCMHPLVSKRKN